MCNKINEIVTHTMNISSLVQEKSQILNRIDNLVHGSIEIREKKGKKYIYVYFRYEGILYSKYAGEYSNELYNLILENNDLVKELKRRIKEINKQLKQLNYVEYDLDSKVELNIDFARKNLVDSIYKQAVLEGVATTYSDTEDIVNGGKVKNMTPSDVEKIINLKHAWEFIMNKEVACCPSNYALLCQINELVEEGFSYSAGKIRSVPVKIGGTNYIPPIPFEDQVKFELQEIMESKNIVDQAVNSLLYIMRKQVFLDGNKRTAVIFANHILIKNGKGLIVIPAEKVDEYKKYLIYFYETNDSIQIKEFLLNNCLLKI